MNSPRSKVQRKKPKVLLPSAAMQSLHPASAEEFPCSAVKEESNGHAPPDLESFAEPPSARNGKKARPGPLSRKAKKAAAALEAGGGTGLNGNHGAAGHQATGIESYVIETPVIEIPVIETPVIETPAIETQVTEIHVSELQVAATEQLPAELFAPDVEGSVHDDSFASTAVVFPADQSAADVEACASVGWQDSVPTTPFPDAPTPPPKEPSPPAREATPSPREVTLPAKEATPLPKGASPSPAQRVSEPATTLAAAGNATPRDYSSFLSVSGRPSFRNASPGATTSTPAHPMASFLRFRDDPPTPFVTYPAKRKAEEAVEGGGVKRVKAAGGGFFARLAAPVWSRFAGREVAGAEELPAEVGEMPAAVAMPANKYCVLM